MNVKCSRSSSPALPTNRRPASLGPARSRSACIVARSCARWVRVPWPSWSVRPTSSASAPAEKALNKPIVADPRAVGCVPCRACRSAHADAAASTLVVATVDDDRRVRESVQSVLESAGYEAPPSNPRKTFLSPARCRRVACVIVDVRLPGMDGTELQRRIRRERHQLPVIFITAHDDDDIRQTGDARWRSRLPGEAVRWRRAVGAHRTGVRVLPEVRLEERLWLVR